jgi:hypothetical protein
MRADPLGYPFWTKVFWHDKANQITWNVLDLTIVSTSEANSQAV